MRIRGAASQPALRQGLVDAGRQAAQRYSDAAVCSQWLELLTHELLPRYAAWRKRPWVRAFAGARGAVWERLLWRHPGGFQLRAPHVAGSTPS